MAKVVGDIAVVVGADIGPLQRGMAGASSSVNKFGRDFDTQSARMAAAAGRVATAIGGITAAAGGIAAVASKVITANRELANLSRVAGVSVERFQTLAYAANAYGIEQEKLADILKDTNDKIGDFVQTGGGALADFFEQIAPKVGVAVDSFRELNSADALALYVSSLEKANVSQAEMTFYLEAIASDATALAPLLANNARELKNLEGAAIDLGIVLDGDMVDRTVRMGQVWDSVVAAMQGRFLSFASTVMIGMDRVFGLTDMGQMESLRRQRIELENEWLSLGDQLDDERARAGRSLFGNGQNNAEIERLEEAREQMSVEMNRVNYSIIEIQEIVAEREELQRQLAEMLENPGDGGAVDIPGGGGGGKKNSYSDRIIGDLQTAREAVDTWYAESLEALANMNAEELEIIGGHNEARLRLEEEYQARLKDIKGQETQHTRASQERALGAFQGFMGTMAQQSEGAAKALLAVNTALSISEAIQNTSVAATRALAELGPIAGPPAAASIKAWGAAEVGLIAANGVLQMGSSGGRGGGGGGGAGIAAAAQTPIQISVPLLPSGGAVSTDMMNELFETFIQQSQDNGAQFVRV